MFLELPAVQLSLMHILQVAILAFVQGMAELLPVSSSAHVIVVEKLMGLDPSSPEMTFLLVMLHTGTMFAVLYYFRDRWLTLLRQPSAERTAFGKGLFLATATTGVIGLILKKVIEKTFFADAPHAEIEMLFSYLPLIAVSLFVVGWIIWFAGKRPAGKRPLETKNSLWIGAVQGLCLPFRGFSRSGATISTGLILGIPKNLSEEFSFALAVILTPPVVARELWRLMKAHELTLVTSPALLFPGLMGMVFSFMAGMLALRWVSSWIERGRWSWFGYYCFAASAGVAFVHWKS